MRRICITRANALTPRGRVTAEGFERAPESFQEIKRFSVKDFPVKIAGEVGSNQQVEMALSLVAEALEDHAITVRTPTKTKLGVFVGAEPERVPLERLAKAQRAASQPEHAVLGGNAYEQRSPARLTEALVQRYQAEGPQLTLSMACAASASAIAKALHSIRNGLCDAALCVGAALNVEPLLFAGFCLLRAMSQSGRCMPFDQRRDGFVLSDGAGCLLLEAEDTVVGQGRAREILGYLEGAGESLDAYRITDPEPTGKGARAAIIKALHSAQLKANEISLVKAHATGTLQNDRVEAQVLEALFPQRPPVLAVKGGIGHSIAACGVIELIAALAALRRGRVEHAFGLTSIDAELASLNIAPWGDQTEKEEAMTGRYALCNTFGFGGINCALLISAPE
jgi:3-oxoacyl-[acyl-carrier-protein] synthase II